MKVILAETAGFCYGVERAVNLARETAKARGGAMLGSIVHNAGVVREIEDLGMRLITSPDQAKAGETVLIRAHGEPRATLDALRERGAEVVSAVCPHVERIRKLAQEAEHEGRRVILIGERHHPEVQGIAGWCSDPLIFENVQEAQKYLQEHPDFAHLPSIMLAQTTCIRALWESCVKFLKKQCTNLKINDTICNATQKRQTEAAELSAKVDAMVVVGDRRSANTRHLTEICRENCGKVLQIESADELSPEFFSGCRVAGLTAGASTPASIIMEVLTTMTEENINTTAPETSESFEELLEKSFKTLNTGDKVTGIVTAIGTTEIQVDVGCKQAGYIPVSELSSDPDVKPEDVVKVGDEIEVSEPAGGFVLDDRETPVVMIAEGIGITPMVAMLSEIATDHPLRRVHLIYSTKNGEHFPLQEETKNLIKLIPDSGMAVGYTEPRFDEHVGQDYQFTGKLMPATLRHACMDAESDVYLCGSGIFVEYVRNIILQYRTIPADHIHTQVFVRTR